MNKKTTLRILILAVTFWGWASIANCSESRSLFSRAKKEAQSGAVDFAYMHYRAALRDDPNSQYRHQLLFANGEYLYWNSDYDQAKTLFNEYTKETNGFEGKLFALAYLFKIAEKEKQSDLIQDIKNKIVALHKHSFIFRDSKTYAYQSPLYHKLKAVYYIDRIEFYVDKELLAKITY